MDSNQEDNSYQNINNSKKQGSSIIHVAPKQPEQYASPSKRTKRKSQNRSKKLPKISNSYQPEHSSQIEQRYSKENERNSQSKIRGADQETAGDMDQSGQPSPYQFLTQRSPSIFRIFFPRFTVKSVTFILTLVYIVMFIILLAYNYSKQQTDITWNCSLYRLQNKYFPRLNINHEIWRVFPSALFHSNIAHFFLNIFSLQLYGYFVEWYYQKKLYILTFVLTMIYSHFFSSVVQTTTVSTTSSAFTMAIIAFKIYFLWEYRAYRKLSEKRTFIYILLGLVFAINLIPIFVMNNVDYSALLGGLIVGFLLGFFIHIQKIEQQTRCDKVLKWLSLLILTLSMILVVALTFILKSEDYQYYSQNIQIMCINNHT